MIPLFSTTATDNKSIYSDWVAYTIANFEDRRNFDVLAIEALNYNLTNCKLSLSSNKLKAFKSILNDLKKYNPSSNFPDILDFVGTPLPENYDILNEIYDGNPKKMWASFMCLNPQAQSELFIYMSHTIYTPKFSELYENLDTYELVRKTTMFIDELKNGTFSSETQDLNFIISTLHLVDIRIKKYEHIQKIENELNLRDLIIVYFKDKYPEKYNNYKILQDLELNITPTELACQLHSIGKINTYPLPELI